MFKTKTHSGAFCACSGREQLWEHVSSARARGRQNNRKTKPNPSLGGPYDNQEKRRQIKPWHPWEMGRWVDESTWRSGRDKSQIFSSCSCPTFLTAHRVSHPYSTNLHRPTSQPQNSPEVMVPLLQQVEKVKDFSITQLSGALS